MAKKKNSTKIEPIRPKYLRPTLFEYPALPKAEIIFYFICVISFMVYEWGRIFFYSKTIILNKHDYKEITNFPLIGPRLKDTTDAEWEEYRVLSFKLIPALVIHSIVFNFSERLLNTNHHLWPIITTIYSVIACSWIFGVIAVLWCVGYGVVISAAATFTRSKAATWVTLIGCLWSVVLADDDSMIEHYWAYVLAGYNMLSFLSYNMEYLDDNARPEDDTFLKRLFRMFYYSFYLPYLVYLVVLYPDFERQVSERPTIGRNWKKILFFAFRIAFWYLFIDFGLHFFYFLAILKSPALMQNVQLDILVAIGYTIIQFFHMKYVVIFGMQSVFAHFDSMQPAPPPICVGRVNLIPTIWRNFDRGLYAFFKAYIFLPIVRPTFSIPRKLAGMLIAYSFVLLWHGMHTHCIVWIALNILTHLMEVVSKGIYTIEEVRMWREKNITDKNFRRVLAWLQIVPFAINLFSVVYFLGDTKIGYVFVDRYFWNEIVHLKMPFLILFGLAYTYSNVCMEVVKLQNQKKDKSE